MLRPLHAVLIFILAPAAVFAADAAAQTEIDYLLRYIEKADGRFVRGGTEYPPKEAAAHLRMKLEKAGTRVRTAEDFIANVASKSYLTGKPYQIKPSKGVAQPAGPWLTQALDQHRKSTARK